MSSPAPNLLRFPNTPGSPSLTRNQIRGFWAAWGGWALDGMDFMIYPLVIGTIITLWKVDAGMAGLAGTVTLLSSAVFPMI